MSDTPHPSGSNSSLCTATAKTLRVVDSHTCGQPTRVIVEGAGIEPGTAPQVARAQLREQDWVRRTAVLEPRGHRSMFAAALIPPKTPMGEYGVVYMDAYGYPDMCGHATIGVGTTLFEEGLIQANDRSNVEFGLLTPAGRVDLRAHLRAGRVETIAFRAPLAFHLGSLQIQIGGHARTVELSYGGQWYAFIDLEGSGRQVDPEDIDELVKMAAQARARIEAAMPFIDPLTGRPPSPINIVWLDKPTRPAADGHNVPVSPAGSFDRSPCGTATCARMATLVAHGQLAIGQRFVNEGLLGTLYSGRAVSAVTHAGIAGIVPEVEGSAWITGRAVLSVDPRDPLRRGYLVGGGPAVT
ncbi:MAG TPA: proline racemase family protein [Steroidobacteraceae bacterium]|nr:proline racemase family protein [Steroidobacteraceae bacterium]